MPSLNIVSGGNFRVNAKLKGAVRTQKRCSIFRVTLDIARDDSKFIKRQVELDLLDTSPEVMVLEQCTCPEHMIGLSCEVSRLLCPNVDERRKYRLVSQAIAVSTTSSSKADVKSASVTITQCNAIPTPARAWLISL